MDLHHQYAVKLAGSTRYVAKDEKGAYTTTSQENEAHTSWSRQGAARMAEDYIKKAWNVTMGEKPTFEIVKVRRPQKIAHPW